MFLFPNYLSIIMKINFQSEQIVLLISLIIVLTLYIILEIHLFDCIIIIHSVVAVALYEERI
jgi:hypothetical protein